MRAMALRPPRAGDGEGPRIRFGISAGRPPRLSGGFDRFVLFAAGYSGAMGTASRAAPEGLIDEALAYLDRGVTDFRRYMATPEGRALRRRVAQAAIFAAPFLFRLKFVRNHPVGRVLGIVGGAALVVKLAEAIRDWEPIDELADELGFAD
jgi:hypothetical protein